MIKVYGLGSQNATQVIAGKYEGMARVEFLLGTSEFFAMVLGATATTSSNPNVHTHTEATTLPSVTIENGVNLTTDSVALLLGCKVNSCTISARIGEAVNCSLDMLYKTETEGTSLDATPATDAEVVMTFAQGSVTLGSTVANVQSFELTINNNLEQVWGLGSRFNTQSIGKSREYSFSMTASFEAAATTLEKLYGGGTAPIASPAETGTLVLSFTNGLSADDERHIEITVTGIQIDEHSMPQDPAEMVAENVTGIGRSSEIIGEDSSASFIFD